MTADINFLEFALQCKQLQIKYCPAHKLEILLAEIAEIERLILEQVRA